ncbi:MAG: DNA alkylation repair protein [Burkholderiales bacterium]
MEVNLLARPKALKDWFDAELAASLADKIGPHHPDFHGPAFVREIASAIAGQELKQRVDTMADALARQLPSDYRRALAIFSEILGPENPHETGMFKEGYWLMPVARYVEKYGRREFDLSLDFIGELTKRHTGEYAIRPFLVAQPAATLEILKRWSRSANFHLRRLASEGPRPRLPWAQRIDLFDDHTETIEAILDNLKSDPSLFVRKSVANHLGDLLKDHRAEAMALLSRWNAGAGPHTRWIIKHALRGPIKKGDVEAIALVAPGA